MKRYIPHFLFTLLVSGISVAGAIKTWTSGETLRASELNANFAHLHTSAGHGHGSIIVNADISASAEIAHSKMAAPELIPKAVVAFRGATAGTACTASPCTIAFTAGVSGVTRTSAGLYVVTLADARLTTSPVFATSMLTTASNICMGDMVTTTTVSVVCRNSTTAAVADSSVSVMILDN